MAGFADETADNINNIVSSTNDLYNSIQSIAETGMSTDINDTDSVLASWEAIKEEALNGESSVANLEQMVGDICSDPKNMILGIGAIFATEGINEITSRYIAAPIAKVLCKKHFTDAQFDDPDAYLKSLGVVDGLDGIDFTNSKLFPDGENTIEIVAVYKVKVIQLFPIENEFVFYQTAETKGWLLGEDSE
ncbi:MAG: hypothetical protein BWY74_04208 [Firmicutes bacterium ADurb.Bin419]|nr:MAG: hypothetical protein BWY74_04208 [Firmicutes bacterium ADurb.Bin419]